MIGKAGREARPRFPESGARGSSPCDGRRPVVPTGLKIGTTAYSCGADCARRLGKQTASRLERGMIERPKSPCVDVCALDARAGLCTGCGRTLGEIGEWSGATTERQHAILCELPKRLAQLAAGLSVPL